MSPISCKKKNLQYCAQLRGSVPPSWSSSLSSLKVLYLNANKGINGSLPVSEQLVASFGCSPFGLAFHLPLAYFAQSLSSMKSLVELQLMDCSFSGGLPRAWSSSLPSLTMLAMHNNKIEGTLPTSWSRMTVGELLLDVDVQDRMLPYQKRFSALCRPNRASFSQALKSIFLGFNLLTGPVPPQWSALSSLVALQVC